MNTSEPHPAKGLEIFRGGLASQYLYSPTCLGQRTACCIVRWPSKCSWAQEAFRQDKALLNHQIQYPLHKSLRTWNGYQPQYRFCWPNASWRTKRCVWAGERRTALSLPSSESIDSLKLIISGMISKRLVCESLPPYFQTRQIVTRRRDFSTLFPTTSANSLIRFEQFRNSIFKTEMRNQG